jgi:hypothetical protein
MLKDLVHQLVNVPLNIGLTQKLSNVWIVTSDVLNVISTLMMPLQTVKLTIVPLTELLLQIVHVLLDSMNQLLTIMTLNVYLVVIDVLLVLDQLITVLFVLKTELVPQLVTVNQLCGKKTKFVLIVQSNVKNVLMVKPVSLVQFLKDPQLLNVHVNLDILKTPPQDVIHVTSNVMLVKELLNTVLIVPVIDPEKTLVLLVHLVNSTILSMLVVKIVLHTIMNIV